MSNLRAYIYKKVPKKWRRRLGKMAWLKPMRDVFFRTPDGYREHTSLISKTYHEFEVQFKFVSSIQIATKAQERGMETTLLKNSMTLLRDVKPMATNNYVVVDVGANFGFLSLVWSKTLCSQGAVFSFEPHPNVHHSFSQSIQLNNSSNITLEPYAVGKTPGQVEISFANTTSNTLESEAKKRAKKEQATVTMTSLDAYCKDFKQLDLIKIDVDGIELAILEGASEILEKLRPIVIVETNGNKEICDYFFAKSYRIFNMKLEEIKTSTTLPLNVFCIPN